LVTPLVVEAFQRAVRSWSTLALHHSDRGVQYAALDPNDDFNLPKAVRIHHEMPIPDYQSLMLPVLVSSSDVRCV
jgi:hypothetical protein